MAALRAEKDPIFEKSNHILEATTKDKAFERANNLASQVLSLSIEDQNNLMPNNSEIRMKKRLGMADGPSRVAEVSFEEKM